MSSANFSPRAVLSWLPEEKFGAPGKGYVEELEKDKEEGRIEENWVNEEDWEPEEEDDGKEGERRAAKWAEEQAAISEVSYTSWLHIESVF
jgi:hypothetical protein